MILQNEIGVVQQKANNEGKNLVRLALTICCVVLSRRMVINELAKTQIHNGHTKRTSAKKNIPSNSSSSCGCECCVPCSSKREHEKNVNRKVCNTNLNNGPRRGYCNARK